MEASTDASDSNSGLLPVVPQTVFFRTVFTALVVAMLMLFFVKDSKTAWDNPPAWALVVGYWMDPLILQALTILGVGVIVMGYLHQTTRLHRVVWCHRLQYVRVCFFVGLSLFFSYGVGEQWLKTAFAHQRPLSYSGDSFILQWTDMATKLGGPSGFIVRQVWLILLAVVFSIAISTQSGAGREGWARSTWGIIAGLIVCTLLVGWQRMARRAHTFFDLSMGIAAGTYQFWLVYYAVVALFHRKRRQPLGHLTGIVTHLAGVSCIFLPIFVFYSETAWLWVVGATAVFTILGLLYVSPQVSGDARVPHEQVGQN